MTRQESTAIVKEPRQQYREIQTYLHEKRNAIAAIAPKYLDTERMVRLALGATSRQPKLLQCSLKSWVMAMMDCAFYGLEPNPVLGHAYLVPFMNNKTKPPQLEVTFMPGYKGLILLACEHAGFDDIETRIVYANEVTGGRFKETPHDPRSPFFHDPIYDEESRGELAGAYAVGWRGVDKRPRFKFMTMNEVSTYQARSRAANDGPWQTDYLAMVQKTVVRRLLALAQLRPGSKLGAALEHDSAAERDEVVHAQPWQVEDPRTDRLGPASGPSKTDRLADELEAKARTKTGPTPKIDPSEIGQASTNAPESETFVP